MIERIDSDLYLLACDNCGDDTGEYFDTFGEAVEYKKDKDNGWRSVKDRHGEWAELCPKCNNARVIAKLKGLEEGYPDSRQEYAKADAALKALEDL
jgi:hypothetical protein